jgi:hypothetical protein
MYDLGTWNGSVTCKNRLEVGWHTIAPPPFSENEAKYHFELHRKQAEKGYLKKKGLKRRESLHEGESGLQCQPES